MNDLMESRQTLQRQDSAERNRADELDAHYEFIAMHRTATACVAIESLLPNISEREVLKILEQLESVIVLSNFSHTEAGQSALEYVRDAQVPLAESIARSAE